MNTISPCRYSVNRQNDTFASNALGMSELGRRVRQARKAEGLTQVQLAKKAGVAQSTISELEKGENVGSVHLVAIARALRRRPQWIETGLPPEFEGGGNWPFTLSAESYQRLSREAQGKIDQYIIDQARIEGVYEQKSDIPLAS